jgi:hypothetical protein
MFPEKAYFFPNFMSYRRENSQSEDPLQTRSNPRRSQIASSSISDIRFVFTYYPPNQVFRVLYPCARYVWTQFSAAADAWTDLMALIKCPHWSCFNFGKKPTPKKDMCVASWWGTRTITRLQFIGREICSRSAKYCDI